ncbi:MAG: c-type cytochrome [OM182 bacterium]|nr:c-type cytochrome [OM182 bacterium]
MFKKMFAVAALSLFAAGGANAQTAADNIRPARQVCLAGQPCVGNKAESNVGMAAEVAPVAAAPMAAAAAPMAEVAASGFDAEATYMASCNACHAAGVANAPKLGDKAAWDARMEKGMDAIMVNVMNGINAMPAKGLCMTCSADDLQEIVNYMVAK